MIRELHIFAGKGIAATIISWLQGHGFWRCVVCLSTVLLAPGLHARGAKETPPHSPTETIIIHGVTPEMVQREVHKLAYAPWESQLPRWDARFCPVVVGLNDSFRDTVLRHLDRTARALIPDLPQHCSDRNVFLFFTDNGTAMFDAIVARVPTLGNGYGASGISSSDLEPPDRQTIQELRRDRPVRWYRSVSTEFAPGGSIGVRAQSGKIDGKGTQARTTSTIVIIDQNLAAGATWGQLADYLVFVVLADPKLGETYNPGSVMSLFNEGMFQKNAPLSLTPFDTTLLHALYEVDPEQDAHAEQVDIVRAVTRGLTSTTYATP